MSIQDSNHNTLLDLAKRSLDNDSMFIVDVEVKGQGSSPIIWVYAESDKGGISLDECVNISRRLQVMIEANELYGDTFTLNVSSPGLDRPLKVTRQYHVNKGRKAKVKYTENGTTGVIEGKLTEADDSGILIDAGSQKKRLEFSSIIETKIQPVF